MAHKKAGGATSNGRDSVAKRRGVKRFGGETVTAGEILIRQKGFWYRPGENTYLGKDWTIHATVPGTVKFTKVRVLKFNGNKERATVIHIQPTAA
ncbi:MAG: large subunit ribosomal protein [Candidatus Peribacteria bacterium]|nr:large subunit ribosomal protein [Candidatus Peribacteria bacterium]